MNILNFDWTSEHIDHLKRRRADGASASVIALELHPRMTRSAVLGKIHRLGLARPPTAPRVSRVDRIVRRRAERSAMRLPDVVAPPMTDPPRATSYNFLKRTIERGTKRAPIRRPPDPCAAADVPEAQRKALHELTDALCRWPYGEPGTADFFFCGAATGVAPYCPAHQRVAYMPVPVRK